MAQLFKTGARAAVLLPFLFTAVVFGQEIPAPIKTISLIYEVTGKKGVLVSYHFSRQMTRVDLGETSFIIDYPKRRVVHLNHLSETFRIFTLELLEEGEMYGVLANALGSVQVAEASTITEREQCPRRCIVRYGADLLRHKMAVSPWIEAWGRAFSEISLECCIQEPGHLPAGLNRFIEYRMPWFSQVPLIRQLDILDMIRRCDGLAEKIIRREQSGVVEWRLRDIVRSESLPALYDLPPGYRPDPS